MATMFDRMQDEQRATRAATRRPAERGRRPAPRPAPVHPLGIAVDVLSLVGGGAALWLLTSRYGIYWGGMVLGFAVVALLVTYGIRATRPYSIAAAGLVPLAVACLFSVGVMGFPQADAPPAAVPTKVPAQGRPAAAPQAAPAAPQQAKEPVAGKEAAPAPTAAPEPPKQAEGKAEAPAVVQVAPAPEKAAEGRAEEPAKEAGGKGAGKQSGGKVQP